MAIVTGDRYLEALVKFVERQAGPLLEGALVLKLNPVGLHYVQTRLEQLQEVEGLLAGAPVDYLRAYVSDLGDYRALEQLRRILRLLTSLKVVSVLPAPARDPTPLSLLPFGRLRLLELRGCDLSSSAARGLLELRHTLEKIVCYNSTDALRHVFASRIIIIKDSPVWNKLTSVSCPCNGIVLMDESLQLLPAVEILDLSRNRFAKVDNLKKCTRLRHLDLGFNHLRTIASLSAVNCPIVKLVLRNNALTAVHGIEHLKSVEGLDLSYNIISNFSELEILGSLSSLKSLWLEGNPICRARWYRAHVFSYFIHSDKLILDERGIRKQEFWKRQIILASRMKRPAACGFYSPAKERLLDSPVNTKMKRLSRLASIEDDELGSRFGVGVADQESCSFDSGSFRRDESIKCEDDDEETTSLSNRDEFVKEGVVSWLQELGEHSDSSPPAIKDNNKKIIGPILKYSTDRSRRKKTVHNCSGNNPLHVSKQYDFGEEVSKTSMESEKLLLDTHIEVQSFDNSIYKKSDANPFHGECMSCDRLKFKGQSDPTGIRSSVIAIEDILGPRSASMHSGSPPHYVKDILHRRHNLEEESLQFPADSYSVASSDCETSSCDDDDSCIYDALCHVNFNLLDEGCSTTENHQREYVYEDDNGCLDEKLEIRQSTDLLDSHNEEVLEGTVGLQSGNDDHKFCATVQNLCFSENIINKRRPRKRIVSLPMENSSRNAKWLKFNGNLEASTIHQNDTNMDVGLIANLSYQPVSQVDNTNAKSNNFVERYFDANIGVWSASETCVQSVLCLCAIQGSVYTESCQVVMLLSSEGNIYIIDTNFSECHEGKPFVLGCHKHEDIKNIFIGLGFQVVRVDFEGHAPYLFILSHIEKARLLLCLLAVSCPAETNSICPFKSWDQLQAEMFKRDIFRGSVLCIYMYSLLLAWHMCGEGQSWNLRSLFLVKGYLFVCTEELEKFGHSVEFEEASPYFTLDLCCSIDNINELVIETSERCCITLILSNAESRESHFLAKVEKEKQVDEESGNQVAWKFKWLSEDIFNKFLSLLRAMHTGVGSSPLSIRSTT